MKLTMLSPIISSLLVLSSCAKNEPSLSVLWQDKEAQSQLKAERYEEALQSYYDLVEKNPNLAGTHSNIGVILNFVQRPEDALKSLEHALTVAKENNDLGAQFAVNFNLGVYFGDSKSSAKDVGRALEHYQAALDIVPTSVEAKTNIELLVQQQQKQQGEGGEKSEQQDQQNQNGQNGDSQNQDNKNDRDKKDEKKDGSDDKKKDEKDKGENEEQKQDEGKKRENSPKYKPRPFKGEELSEGDVKKILGELRNQEQKIRANFEKKEKGKTKRNEKDW